MWENEQFTPEPLTPEQRKAAETAVGLLTDYIEIADGTFRESHGNTSAEELALRAEQAYRFVRGQTD
jgi:hypothetical protein